MNITLDNLGKKYHREWIFKDLNYEFKSGNQYAITGHNGSGKSTLIQIIAGAMLPTQGNIDYRYDEQLVPMEDVYQHISVASPYLELIEEMTLWELLNFHFKFKPLAEGTGVSDILDLTYLSASKNKLVKNFSSGMKQRLKLGLCFFSDSNILLLDEPTSNLDQKGMGWYQSQVSQLSNKIVIIASNQQNEYQHCADIINIGNYK